MWITCGKVVNNTGKLSTIRGYPHSFIRKSGKSKNFPIKFVDSFISVCKNDWFYTGFVDSLGMITILCENFIQFITIKFYRLSIRLYLSIPRGFGNDLQKRFHRKIMLAQIIKCHGPEYQ